jgi:uncharacterized protein YraI
MTKKWVLLGGMAIILGISRLWAQEACPILTPEILAQAREMCADNTVNILCLASDGILVNDSALDSTEMPVLDTVTRVQTQADSVAVLYPTGGLGVVGVQTILYGEASITNTVTQLTGESVTLPMTNIAGYDINLRQGPATTFNTIGTFPDKGTAMVDGRSADNLWFRLQTDASQSWVSASLVKVDGDISILPIVDSPYDSPFQAFTLQTSVASSDCTTRTSGLLVQYFGEAQARFGVNGAEITFSAATFLLQADAEAGLQVQVLSGDVQVKANKGEQFAQNGEAISVALDSETLLASDTPDLIANYTYANMASAPLELLNAPNANLCVTGVPLTVEAVLTRGGPGEAYSELAPLDNQSHYEVAGFANDANDATWYKLDNGRWVEASNAMLAGGCSALAQVDAPPLRQEQSVVSNQSLVPTANTRWQAYSGDDVMTGTCSSAPIAVCDHLAVVVVNADGSLAWRGQEPISYPLTAQGDNRFTYSGRNFQNNANLSLDLTFTSSTAWTMTMTTVFDADPTCTHTFYYTAVKL